MRVLAVDEEPSDSFTLAEFSGGAGAWTVPHLHRSFEESFFILDGSFTLTVADEAIAATPGTYVLVPRNTAHTICAGEGGGRLLTLMVPGGSRACSSNSVRCRRTPSPTSRSAAKYPPATTPSPS
ncbi:MAG TPA: cupin domain-containing protein [Jatrophihabitantaceae bacterium]|jgi:quercetin dioxygenase-like cupin family protein